jgi:hypothetical protein
VVVVVFVEEVVVLVEVVVVGSEVASGVELSSVVVEEVEARAVEVEDEADFPFKGSRKRASAPGRAPRPTSMLPGVSRDSSCSALSLARPSVRGVAFRRARR